MYAFTRNFVRSPVLRQGLQIEAIKRQVSLKVVPVSETVRKESFFERNERLGRSLSPHLTIYKPQLTTILSILHRSTGIMLGTAAYAIGLAALISSHDVNHYVTIVEGLHLSSGSLIAIKFILAAPVGYHGANGIRHLLWDTGCFLKIKEVYSSGYAMLGVSAILTAILALL